MLQTLQSGSVQSGSVQLGSLATMTEERSMSPAAMALYLRRTNGDAALCFAQAIYEDAAWANDDWGAYWADVVRLV